MRLAPLLLLAACFPEPEPTRVEGVVTRDGVPAPDLPVFVGELRTRTDADGRFSVEVPAARTLPAPVVLASAEEAVLVMDCDGDVAVDLVDPVRRELVPVDLILRRVEPPPSAWEVRLQTLEGTEREPVFVPWDPPLVGPVQNATKPTRYDGRMEAPPDTTRWAASFLAYRGRDTLELSQAAFFPSDGLVGGDDRVIDLFMSDETLRRQVPWDASGPPGVSRARFVQEVEVFEFLMEAPVWQGPADGPVEVPVVQLRETDPVGYRAEFDYNGAGACRTRTVGLPASLGPGTLPADWLSPGDTGEIEVAEVVRVDAELPSPPLVDVDTDALVLSVRFVPDDAERITGRADLGTPSWRIVGEGGCGGRVDAAWPEGLSLPDAPLSGEVRWDRGEVWAACTLGR